MYNFIYWFHDIFIIVICIVLWIASILQIPFTILIYLLSYLPFEKNCIYKKLLSKLTCDILYLL